MERKEENWNLSARATKYLKRLSRDSLWLCNADQVRAYLSSQNLPMFDVLMQFQILFSGFKLTIAGSTGDAFYLQLFSKKQIAANEKIHYEVEGNHYWFECGYHETGQFLFCINQIGEICTLDKDQSNIIHSSVEKLIEHYAIRNELSSLYNDPQYYHLNNNDKLEEFLLRKNFSIISECSDKYSTWYTNENITLIRGTWYDQPKSYLYLYAKNKVNCNDLIKELKMALLI
ncbi:hypothetical protein ACI6Q2_01440 [Chitinophagaceae bacterium LWZ2-11]